eukprot:m.1615123 g.1615123  ORF g.1615123 m.1615123 type:complete len:64 (-) comp25371_c2_seq2:1049-1240(-)
MLIDNCKLKIDQLSGTSHCSDLLVPVTAQSEFSGMGSMWNAPLLTLNSVQYIAFHEILLTTAV